MLFRYLYMFFDWLPTPFNVICGALIGIFVLITLARLIARIWDVLPFV